MAPCCGFTLHVRVFALENDQGGTSETCMLRLRDPLMQEKEIDYLNLHVSTWVITMWWRKAYAL